MLELIVILVLSLSTARAEAQPAAAAALEKDVRAMFSSEQLLTLEIETQQQTPKHAEVAYRVSVLKEGVPRAIERKAGIALYDFVKGVWQLVDLRPATTAEVLVVDPTTVDGER